jgi:hypothetical protein
MHGWDSGDTRWRKVKIDNSTDALMTMSHGHHEVHEGAHFYLTYSAASVGALAAPDDMMTLSWKTPNTTKQIHFVYTALCSSGAQLRMIEGKTGGGASPTGTTPVFNSDRNSANTSGILDVSGATAGVMSYDATLFTGGTTLIDEYVGSVGIGGRVNAGTSRADQEIILKQNTFYQLSLYETDTVPGTLMCSWYEHTNAR